MSQEPEHRKYIEKTIFTENQVKQALKKKAREIVDFYITKKVHEVILVPILTGGSFVADELKREMLYYLRHKINTNSNCRHYLEFKYDPITLSSRGISTKQPSCPSLVRIEKDVKIDPRGCHVLLIDDIADTATSLTFMKRLTELRNALSVMTFVMIDRPIYYDREINIDFSMFTYLEEGWLVGMGMDWNDRFRTLPDIREVKKEYCTE